MKKTKIIGIGGLSRSGKDTFVKVAHNILKQNGYDTCHLAFATALKNEIQQMFRNNNFNLDIWTDDTERKKRLRDLLVWWGCMRRELGDGNYWIDRIQERFELIQRTYSQEVLDKSVFFVSDVRFPNESKWIHEKWGGWFIHVKKYSMRYDNVQTFDDGNVEHSDAMHRMYDSAPNEEEAKQDPLIQEHADDKLELENVIERETRLGNKITVADLPNNTYLLNEVRLCLAKVPLLKIK